MGANVRVIIFSAANRRAFRPPLRPCARSVLRVRRTRRGCQLAQRIAPANAARSAGRGAGCNRACLTGSPALCAFDDWPEHAEGAFLELGEPPNRFGYVRPLRRV